MAFHQTRRTRSIMLWMLSTKFMPAVGVLVPIYLILVSMNLLDTRIALIALTFLGNLPLIVWMLFSYFKEVPGEILEAGRMDGAGPLTQLRHLLLPLTAPGICVDRPAVGHPLLERSVLVHQRHRHRCRHAGIGDCILRQFRRPVLGQAVGRLAGLGGACSRSRLDDTAPAGARPHVRRGEIGND